MTPEFVLGIEQKIVSLQKFLPEFDVGSITIKDRLLCGSIGFPLVYISYMSLSFNIISLILYFPLIVIGLFLCLNAVLLERCLKRIYLWGFNLILSYLIRKLRLLSSRHNITQTTTNDDLAQSEMVHDGDQTLNDTVFKDASEKNSEDSLHDDVSD